MTEELPASEEADRLRKHSGADFRSVAVGLAAAFILWLFVAPVCWGPLADPDSWWLIWAGEQALNGDLPRVNGLAWTAANHPWITHEYAIALLYGWVGPEGLGLVRGLLQTAVSLMLLALAWRRDSGWATILALVWAIPLLPTGLSERPLAWGNLLLGIEVWLLYMARFKGRLPLAALLVGLWANVHGTFVVGLLLLGLTSPLWALPAAALTLLNPHGLALWILVLDYGGASELQRLVHHNIEEWDWLVPNTAARASAVVRLALAGLVVFTDRPWRPKLIWLLLTLLAVRHNRFVMLVGVALLPFVAQRLATLLPAREIWRPERALLAALIVTALIAGPRVEVDSRQFPPGLPELIPEGSRVYNDLPLGGYLGYRGVAPFWDPRNDCYPAEVFADGIRVARLEEGWYQVLARWRVDLVITMKPELARRLEAMGWTLVGRAGAWEVWRRRHEELV